MEPEIRLNKVCVKDMARQLEASMYGRPLATDEANATEEDAFADAAPDVVTYAAGGQSASVPSANSSGYGSTESETFRTSDVLHTQHQNGANHSDEEEVFLSARPPDESDIFSEEFEKTFNEDSNIANTLCESIQDILLVSSSYSHENLVQQINSIPLPPKKISALDYIPSAYFPVPNATATSHRGIHAQRASSSNYPVQNTRVIPSGQSIHTARYISLGDPRSSTYSVEVHQESPAYPSEPPSDRDIGFHDYISSPSINRSHPQPANPAQSDYSVPYNGFSARRVEIPVYVQNQNFDINYQIPNSINITPPHHFPKLSLKTFRHEPEVVSSEPEEDWPPPPENLDQFSDEQEYFAAQENSSKPTNTLAYSPRMADSTDPSDRGTAEGQHVPRFAIREPIPEESEVFDDSALASRKRRSLPNYENVVLTRSKSERGSRQAHYENVDTDFTLSRRNSDTAQQSRGPAYENVGLVLLPNTQRKHVQCARDFYGDEQDQGTNGVSQDSGYYRSDGEPGHLTLSPPSRRGPPMQMVEGGSEDDDEEDDEDDDDDDDDDSSNEDSDNSYYTDSDFDDDDLNDEVHTMSEDQLSMILSDMSLSSESSETIPKTRLTSSTSSVDSASSQPSSLVVELLRMERAHVERLHFLCRVVLLNLKVLTHLDDVTVLPTDVMKQIFSNIEVIYSFHSTDLLPGLEDKVNSWSEKSTIGDLLKRAVPFFKLYTDFAENFTKKLQLYDTWLTKSKLFAVLVREIESTPECRRLSLKQHLLDVVHYVSKYQAMLKEYTDNLPENVEEKTEIEETVALIDSTVRDLERAMGKEDRMIKLRDVQNRIEGCKTTVVKPTRELTKEGKIKIIGQETGKKLDRYVFLFNDSLLLCTPASMGSKHRVRFWLDVEGMQINNGDNLEYPNTFYVLNKRKAVEFHASSHEAKMEWVEAIRGVIDSYTKSKISGHLVCLKKQDIVDEDIGKVPPRLVQACLVSACTLCAANLVAMKKKHHCKACGHVICGKCCSHKLPLEFDKKRQSKVCDECYVILRSQDIKDEEEMWTEQTVSKEDPAKISGNLAMSSQTGKSWHKRYIAVNHNGLLYCYKNKKDSQPWSNLPLSRFRLGLTSKTDTVHKANIFKLLNSRKTYYFQATTVAEAKRWMEVISDIVDSEV